MTYLQKNCLSIGAFSLWVGVFPLVGCGATADLEDLDEVGAVAQPLPVQQQVVRKSFTIDAHATTGFSVQCPSNTKATGGGYLVQTQDRVLRNRRYQNGWAVRVQDGSGRRHTVQAYAICFAAGIRDRSFVAASASVAAGSFEGVGVECPPGKIVVGGGWYTNDADLYVTASTPVYDIYTQQPTQWAVAAKNFDAAPNTLEVRAICADLDGLVADSASAGQWVDPGDHVPLNANCPAGFSASGGGLWVSDGGTIGSRSDAMTAHGSYEMYENDWAAIFASRSGEKRYAVASAVCLGSE